MKLPKTSDDIKSEILNSSDKRDQLGDQRLLQLIQFLNNIDHEIIVEGVMKVFENTDRPNMTFQDQEFAGQILQKIKPKSKKDLTELLTRTLENWDKSVEQLPFWFCDNYGIDFVTDTCINPL